MEEASDECLTSCRANFDCNDGENCWDTGTSCDKDEEEEESLVPTPAMTSSPSVAGTSSPVSGTVSPIASGGTMSPSSSVSIITTASPNNGGGLEEVRLACPESLDNSKEISTSSTLYYAMVPSNPPNSNNGILCGRLEVENNGWVGLGFSTSGQMVGSEAIIGIPSEDTVQKYELTSQSTSGVIPMEDTRQTLVDTSITTNDSGVTIMEFTKLLVEEDEIPILEDGDNIMLNAWGGETLGFHNVYLAFRLDFEGGGVGGTSLSPTVSDGSSTRSPNTMETYVPTYAPTSGNMTGTLSPAGSSSSIGTIVPTPAGSGMGSSGTLSPAGSSSGGGTGPPISMGGGDGGSTSSPSAGSDETSTSRSISKSDLEMDLFGLLSLSFEDQFHYTEQTAAYLIDFWSENGNPDYPVTVDTSSPGAIFISIQDQSFDPMGTTSGPDCSDIDPVTIIYTLGMQYTSSDPNLSDDDVITYPFSTFDFQQRYVNNYLKADDITGGFQTLQCVSEVRIPESGDDSTLGVEVMPTLPSGEVDDSGLVNEMLPGTEVVAGEEEEMSQESQPTNSPIVEDDDIFGNIDVRMTDPLLSHHGNSAHEKKCNNKLRSIPQDAIEELEVSFAYGIESTSEEYDDLIEDMESLMLDFVATSVLQCSDESEGSSPVAAQLRKKKNSSQIGNNDGGNDSSVIRIRYPEYGQITTVCKSFKFILPSWNPSFVIVI